MVWSAMNSCKGIVAGNGEVVRQSFCLMDTRWWYCRGDITFGGHH